MPLLKEYYPPTPILCSWVLQSLFAAFNVVLLIIISGLFFAFPCRWLAQNGYWIFPISSGLLFLLTFVSLLLLNFSDPGILHQGSDEQGPTTMPVVWVNQRAFRLQWCRKCCFHRPPRTFHCPWCNICVEDFDHHCKWVNNCVGHRNFRFFMLLLVSLCLYSGVVLAASLIFLVRVASLPFSIDKAIAILVTIPAAGCLVPVSLLLLLQIKSVSAGERSYEGKDYSFNHGVTNISLRIPDNYKSNCVSLNMMITKLSKLLNTIFQLWYIQGYNPFDHGCVKNWYLVICAPLGTKYMAEAVWLQRVVGPTWVPRQHPHFPSCPLAHSPLASPGADLQSQSLGLHKPRKGPPGSGEASVLPELHASLALPLLREDPR